MRLASQETVDSRSKPCLHLSIQVLMVMHWASDTYFWPMKQISVAIVALALLVATKVSLVLEVSLALLAPHHYCCYSLVVLVPLLAVVEKAV